MTWDALIGQSAAKEYLRAVLNARRVAHGYLFQGPVGVGKRTAAYVLAQIAMCHRPPALDEACGECKSCRWFAGRSGMLIEHPDVISLLKFSSNGTETLVGDQEPAIRLETVQYVCEQLHRSPMAGNRRCVIIPEAQRLCRGQAEPANAFLKTLEEPPDSALVIMTTSQPEGVLETILSRLQIVQFRRLATDEIRTGLDRALPKIAENERTLAATLSDGSLGRAIELLGGDLGVWRQAVLKGLDQFSATSNLPFGVNLWALAVSEGKRLFAEEKERGKEASDDDADEDSTEPDEGAAKTEAGWTRYVFRRLLELCEVCFRDALVVAAGGDAATGLLLQPDQKKLATTLGGKFGAEGCEKALLSLKEALTAVRLYVRGDVVARALVGRWASACRN